MKKIIALFIVILLSLWAPIRSAMAYTPLGCGQLASLSSATLLSSVTGGIPNGTTFVFLTIETEPVRMRDDGVAPTGSIGLLLPVGGPWPYSSTTMANLQFIQTTSSAVIDYCFER